MDSRVKDVVVLSSCLQLENSRNVPSKKFYIFFLIKLFINMLKKILHENKDNGITRDILCKSGEAQSIGAEKSKF